MDRLEEAGVVQGLGVLAGDERDVDAPSPPAVSLAMTSSLVACSVADIVAPVAASNWSATSSGM